MKVSIREFFFLLLCLVLFATLGALLYRDLNASLLSEGDAMASLGSRSIRVQRSSASSSLWGAVSPGAALYDGDGIRTSEGAEAELVFSDDSRIHMRANTMITVERQGEESQVVLNTGFLSLVCTQGSGNLTLRSGDTLISLDEGELTMGRGQDGELQVAVEEGCARVSRGDCSVELSPRDALDFGEDGKLSLRQRQIFLQEPKPDILLFSEGEESDIPFRWEAPPALALRLEIAGDREFSRPLISLEVREGRQISCRLAPGEYFWRISSAEESTLPRRLVLAPSASPRMLSPSSGALLEYNGSRPRVRFRWQEEAPGNRYQLEIAAEPGMTQPLFSEHLEKNPFSWLPPGDGPYYLRIRASYGNLGYGPYSELLRFSLAPRRALLPSHIFSPAPGEVFADGSEGIEFAWEAVEGSGAYRLEIARDPEFRDYRSLTTAEQTILREPLAPGRYYWRVRAGTGEEDWGPPSASRSFRIFKAEEPLALLSPGPEERLSPAEPVRFAWDGPREGAAYRFRLFICGPEGEALLTERVLDGRETTFPFLPAGAYRWDMALSLGGGVWGEASSSRSFKIEAPLAASGGVAVSDPAPRLIAPPEGFTLSSWEIRKEGLRFRWDDRGSGEGGNLILRKADEPDTLPVRYDIAGKNEMVLYDLSPGRYDWRMEIPALSDTFPEAGGFRRLVVTGEGLPSPVFLSPGKGESLSREDGMDLELRWRSGRGGSGEERYALALWKRDESGEERLLLMETDLRTENLSLDLPGEGEYYGRLTASQYNPRLDIYRESSPAEFSFALGGGEAEVPASAAPASSIIIKTPLRQFELGGSYD